MSDDADDISDALEKNDGNPGTLSFIKNALSSSCEGLYTQLEEFIQSSGQENKKIYRKQIIKERR